MGLRWQRKNQDTEGLTAVRIMSWKHRPFMPVICFIRTNLFGRIATIILKKYLSYVIVHSFLHGDTMTIIQYKSLRRYKKKYTHMSYSAKKFHWYSLNLFAWLLGVPYHHCSLHCLTNSDFRGIQVHTRYVTSDVPYTYDVKAIG